MWEISTKNLKLICALGAIAGYALYLAYKRTSDESSVKSEARKEKKSTSDPSPSEAQIPKKKSTSNPSPSKVKIPEQKSTSDPSELQIPDMKTLDQVEIYFNQQMVLGEELIVQGDIEKGVKHLCQAAYFSEDSDRFVLMLQQLMPDHFTEIAEEMPRTKARIEAQLQEKYIREFMEREAKEEGEEKYVCEFIEKQATAESVSDSE